MLDSICYNTCIRNYRYSPRLHKIAKVVLVEIILGKNDSKFGLFFSKLGLLFITDRAYPGIRSVIYNTNPPIINI